MKERVKALKGDGRESGFQYRWEGNAKEAMEGRMMIRGSVLKRG